MNAAHLPLAPGSTIGILGGGQLGRMLSVAALQLGYKVIGYAPPGDNVAADGCSDFCEARWDDDAALGAFSERCDIVTFEFENVPLSAVAAIDQAKLACPMRALEVAQDRLAEKQFAGSLGATSAPFAQVTTRPDLDAAIAEIGVPGILKTARDGYDGKGQWRILKAEDAATLRLPDTVCIYEGMVAFECEFSVILARSKSGEVRFWQSSVNHHEGGMLSTSQIPAGALIEAQMPAARDLARACADALGYVGVLTLEFFATKDGPIFNEMAPRVHNSGHWTIEAAATSQFENHIRAIAGLPLGETTTRFAQVEMRNIVGEEALEAYRILAEEGEPHLHLYGKSEARSGRKMGHVTRVRQPT